eukprot:CAMPEP_0113461118 /NCGR_PEP_ID=MMETSP0014_2-20120614/11369_1 /TAXON_ID=2857 /ORGANISM="Nitzschia sp." /LENGTH=628 /DNA_ID=CAMNT_0000352855 /DNA_START=239 /DNA_END=2125 /DNA_ORIENTATION=- /assembly_acc=CAM_ASM_000159
MEQELNNNSNQGYYSHAHGNGHPGGDEREGQQQQYHPGGPPQPLASSTAAAAATATFSPTPATFNSTYTPQEPTPPAVAIARSSPIAIQRPHSPSSTGGGRYHFGNQGRSGDVTSDDDDDDDDYDTTTTNVKTSTQNNIIDVEGDAKKLRRKYGNQSTVTGVVHNQNVVQTYQQESSYLRQGLARDDKEPLLKAPYFGSLNRSADQVLSLPPMSLESAGLGISGGTMDEPPGSIPSSASALGSVATARGTTTTRTAYGSLRDSQEKGRFLDGPSSYREPTSGRIRQLDHRVRYHGRTAESPQVSISERMQQARKLKETRQKELANADSAGAAPSGSATNTSTSTSTSASGTTTPSSLSAMMDEVSKKEDPRPAVLQPMTAATENNRWGDNSYRGGLGHIGDVDNDDDVDDNDNDVPHAMLSTSLTAFEVLKTTNVIRGPSGGGATNMATTTYSSSLLPPTSSTPVFTTDGLAVSNNNNATLPTGLASINANSPYHGSAVHQQRTGAVIRQDRFQPLSRSLSDPSPGYQQQQFSLRERTALMSSPTYGPVAANTTPTSPTVQFSLPPPQQQQQQYPQYLAPAGFGVVASTVVAAAAATSPQNDDGSLIQSDTERQISETEGAFGDMDLE